MRPRMLLLMRRSNMLRRVSTCTVSSSSSPVHTESTVSYTWEGEIRADVGLNICSTATGKYLG